MEAGEIALSSLQNPGLIAHTYNPSDEKWETGDSLATQPSHISEFQEKLRPCLKNQYKREVDF